MTPQAIICGKPDVKQSLPTLVIVSESSQVGLSRPESIPITPFEWPSFRQRFGFVRVVLPLACRRISASCENAPALLPLEGAGSAPGSPSRSVYGPGSKHMMGSEYVRVLTTCLCACIGHPARNGAMNEPRRTRSEAGFGW